MTEKQKYEQTCHRLTGASLAMSPISPEFAELLRVACDQLKEASGHMCSHGFFGCDGGEDCDADHK